MSDMDQTARNRGCDGEVAAYALGSLDEHEVDSFRHHLDGCVVCRDELAAFQQVVDLLPMSAPSYQAPPALRRRVLRAAAKEAKGGAPARARRWTAFSLPRPALALSAGMALAVAAVVVVLSLGSSASRSVRVIAAQVSGPGEASLHVSPSHTELVVHRFAAPPAGQIYEVWLQRGTGTPQPTKALFSVTDAGDAVVDVPGNLHGVSRVMVTREPAGGTSRPTHPPVIQAPLT